jgi:hypothetical protein
MFKHICGQPEREVRLEIVKREFLRLKELNPSMEFNEQMEEYKKLLTKYDL